MIGISVNHVKFFRPVRPKREQFLRADVDNRSIKSIHLVKGVGIIVTAICQIHKEEYQFVVPMNNLEAITLSELVVFDKKIVEPTKEEVVSLGVKKSKK